MSWSSSLKHYYKAPHYPLKVGTHSFEGICLLWPPLPRKAICCCCCWVASDSLQLHELQHTRLPWLSLSPGVCSNSFPLNRWCYLIIPSSATPFSFCLQSFLVSGSFPMSWLFTSGGQSIGASALASVLPMSIQGWFPWELTDLISLLSKGLSTVLPSTTIQKHEFFGAQPSGPTLTSIHDYWKNYSLDYTDLCQQSDASAS